MNRTNYIFVDFENIHEVDLDRVAGKAVMVILVLGQRHTSLPVELVKKLLKYSTQVRLVETSHAGKNALDFVLAYHIGKQSVADPEAFFHILSRDKGFDALVLHLKDNRILASRHESFTNIPVLNDLVPGLDDRVTAIIGRFVANKINRPKREKTLLSHIHAHFGKRMTESELRATKDALVAQGAIGITAAGMVVYKI